MSARPGVRAILFDKDGTLLDFNGTWLPRYQSAAEWIAGRTEGRISAAELLADGGYLVEQNCWQPDSLLASGSNLQILQRWEFLLQRKLSEPELAEIAQIFQLGGGQYLPVVEPIRPCLERLQSRGFILGIATMDDEIPARTTARGMGIEDLFTFICGADSGFGVKPEPGMVQAFASQAGVDVTEVVMVGDSPRDIHMGQNAGAGLSIGVLTGAHKAAELSLHTPHVLADISQLDDFLLAFQGS